MTVARQFIAWDMPKEATVPQGQDDRSQAIHCLGHAQRGDRPVGTV